MGFWGCVCSAVSAVASYVGGAISSIGSAMTSFASRIIANHPNQIELELGSKIIAEIFGLIADIFGLKEKEEKVDELGAKALQEDTMSRDEFKTEKEYIEYLRKEIELDRAKFENMSKEEKLACEIIGATILTKGIEEKTKVEIPPEFLHSVEKTGMTANEVKDYIEKFSEKNISSMGLMSDYLQGKNIDKNTENVFSAIKEVLREHNPNMSESKIDEKIIDMIKQENIRY